MRRVRFAARLATELIGCFSNVNLPFRALEEAPGCPHWCAARHWLYKFGELIAWLSALPLAGRVWPSRHHIRAFRFWAAIPEVRHLTTSATYRRLSRQSFDCRPRMTSAPNMLLKESAKDKLHDGQAYTPSVQSPPCRTTVVGTLRSLTVMISDAGLTTIKTMRLGMSYHGGNEYY